MSSNGACLLVGASGGIGLALATALLARPTVTRLLASHRPGTDSSPLEALAMQYPGRLEIISLDVTSADSLSGLTDTLARVEGGFDLAIHAAGILHGDGLVPEKSLEQCEPDSLLRLFGINSIGPLMVARALLPLQDRQRRFTFAALSAMVGSIEDNRLGGWYGYRASKAALNQFIRTLANECRSRYPQAAVVALHPGTTDTALSRPFQRGVKPGKLYSPAETAARLLAVLDGVDSRCNGRFLNWNGSEIPW